MSNETDWKERVLDFEIKGLELKPVVINDMHKSIKAEMRQLLKQWYGSDFEERHEIEILIASAMKNLEDRNIYKYNWAYWIWAFYCDDQLEQDEKVAAKWVEKIVSMHSNDDTPLDMMFNYYMDGFKSYLPKDLLEKMVDEIKNWAKVNCKKSLRQVCLDGNSEVDINEYLNSRLYDVWCGKGFIWLELVLSTNLMKFRKDEKINEIIEKFDRNSALLGLCHNEIYSLKKEVKQNVMKWNYVYIRMKKEGITAQEAVDAIVVDIKEYRRLMYSFGSELKQLGIQAISAYVDKVIDTVEGVCYWSSVGARYHDPSLY